MKNKNVSTINIVEKELAIRQITREDNPCHRRTKKEIAIFAQRFKAVWIKKPHMSFAQLVGFAMIGYGFNSFKKDFEVIAEMERIFSKDYAFGRTELQGVFTYDNPNIKKRRCQIDLFIGRFKKIWKANPHTSFAKLIGQITMGKNFCSFKEDEDMIESIEKV